MLQINFIHFGQCISSLVIAVWRESIAYDFFFFIETICSILASILEQSTSNFVEASGWLNS